MAPKECTLCHTPRQLLVRCQIDESQTWHFVCAGKCWISVSGGVEDARGLEGRFPNYRYGGMWKDRHADGPVSAKKPRRVKERQRREAEERRLGGKGDGVGKRGEGSGSEGGEEEDEDGSEEEDKGGVKTQSQDAGDASKAGESVLD